ncbi:ECF transporter S component [Clostridium sp. D2Q-14]|uniref:ECF transporter S component n=1 Tax=Anaeromonas gelatinilytica TaxID=2683194 RepID=UPI00193BAB3F|nr:ECF transporter S component [Anaeromonas gelatinilytica]MBS4535697.1 ECF transporter S component [Anaeromonas gelatinilytica]
MKKKAKKPITTKRLAIIGMLGGISAILGLTPIGFIPIGPTNATIMHIPVIIGAIIEGPVVGVLVGLIFGIFSIIRAITAPTVVSPLFYNPLVSVLPRLLIGITAYYSYITFKKMGKKSSIITLVIIWVSTIFYLGNNLISGLNTGKSMTLLNIFLILITISVGYYSFKKFNGDAVEIVISSAIGTLTNTIGVLGMIYLLYGEKYVELTGGDTAFVGKAILSIGIANGIPEVIVAMIIVTAVVSGVKKKV